MNWHTCRTLFLNKWEKPLWATGFLFVALTLFFIGVYTFVSGDPLPDDRYFHLKYAEELRTDWSRAVDHFDWIYLSGHGQEGGSRYAVTLFQVLLIPFTYFSDQIFALYVMSSVIASATVALMYYVMRTERVRHSLFFVMIMVSSTYFVSRMLLGRAYVLVMGVLLYEMYLAIHQKYKMLFAVVVFHVLWHESTYFMPILIVGIVEGVRYMMHKKISLHTIGASIGGVIVGMAFHPGFPASLVTRIPWFMNIHTTGANNYVGATETDVKVLFDGAVEWEMLFLFLAIGLVVTFFLYRSYAYVRTQINDPLRMQWVYNLGVFALIVSICSFTISGRFFDFILPSAIFLIAMLYTVAYDKKIIVVDTRWARWMAYALWIWLVVLGGNAVRNVYSQGNAFDYRPAQSVAQWVQKESDERDKVFLQNWSAFTLMYFANTHNVYSMGIEPTTLKSYDEKLYWKYFNMFTYRYYCDKPKDCKEEFDAYQKRVLSADQNERGFMEKENSRKIITSIKKDFDAQFIVSSSANFSRMIMLNPDLIADQYNANSDRFDNTLFPTDFTAFKLK